MSAAATSHAEPVAGSVAAAAGAVGPPRQLAPPDRRPDPALLAPLEPERRVDDWGRSERLEAALDAGVGEFLYRRWFRCAVDGVERVPAEGPVLLAANHAGLLLPGALMVAKALREEHPRPRPLQVAVASRFRSAPGLSMLIGKLGGIAAHPANLERALVDEGGVLLATPEPGAGAGRPYRERYRLRPFAAAGPIEPALRAGAAIVPVCVVGAEEAMPALGRARSLERLGRLPALPLTPVFPWLAPLGIAAYLPARFELRFLPPLRAPALSGDPGADEEIARGVRAELRARLQEGLSRILGERRSAWWR